MLFENISFKEANLPDSTWKHHNPNSLLDPVSPQPLVDAPINPVHFPVAMPFVLHVCPLVVVATLPNERALPVLPVEQVVALVGIALLLVPLLVYLWLLLPLPFPVFEPSAEQSCVTVPIGPLVLPVALWLPYSRHSSRGLPYRYWPT